MGRFDTGANPALSPPGLRKGRRFAKHSRRTQTSRSNFGSFYGQVRTPTPTGDRPHQHFMTTFKKPWKNGQILDTWSLHTVTAAPLQPDVWLANPTDHITFPGHLGSNH